MEAYNTVMDSLGESIINFVDPNKEFVGYTEVSRGRTCDRNGMVWFGFQKICRSWLGPEIRTLSKMEECFLGYLTWWW
jgi:hypothetical protein